MNNIYKGAEIIELLKEQGIQLDKVMENTINMLAYEVFENGKNEGIEEGRKLGIKQACKDFEIKISTMRSKLED